MSEALYHHSALYDAMYADVVADVPLLCSLARQAGGPTLELCCGNGRLLVPAREAGLDVDGLDLSVEMLAGLREKLRARGLTANLHQGDMVAFAVPRRYALVYVGFNSFLHNLTQDAQLATLRRCREHLAPGGKLAVSSFHPAADKLLDWAAGEKLVKEIPNAIGPGRVRVRDLTTDDRIEQVRRVIRHVDFLDDAGALVRTATTRFDIRYVFKPEMELLLRQAGFARWRAQALEGDATRGQAPVERALREGDLILWTAWGE